MEWQYRLLLSSVIFHPSCQTPVACHCNQTAIYFSPLPTHFTEFKITMLVFKNLVNYTWMFCVSVCYWHVMPKFANLSNEKIIQVIGNIRGFCDE